MTGFIHTLFLLLGFSLWEGCAADPWKHLQDGDQAAQEFLNQMERKKKEAGPHPFYQGISKEANLKDADLEGSARTLVRKDSVGQMISEGYGSRPKVKIDLDHDPMIKRSKEVMENSLKQIGGEGTKITQGVQGGKDETLTCEEPGEDYIELCKKNLKVTVIKTKVKKELRSTLQFWMSQGAIRNGQYLACGALRHGVFRPWECSGNITGAYKVCMQELGKKSAGCVKLPSINFNASQIKQVSVEHNSKTPRRYYKSCSGVTHNSLEDPKSYYNCQAQIKIVYEEDSYQVLPDEWILNCDQQEEKADQGLCSYASKDCTQGPQTRIIEGLAVTRNCWQETFTYNCTYPSKDDCGPLRARGCVQINSTCKEKVGNTCVAYTQTYQCKGNTQQSDVITGGQTPFCLDGNCRDQGWDRNDEMMSSIAQLSLLKEMQGQWKSGSFFKGEDHQCSKYIEHFKDCCGSGKGWGKSVGLAGDCKPEEKALSLKRKARLCHFVGTYCDEKFLGKCIKKKSTYCCFGSKLLKAFHEQGRPQIGLGWGSPKEPLCRGFTIEEIKRIDFSKLDLREVFEDLIKNYQPGKLQGTGKTIGDRLEVIKKGVLPKTEKQPKQRNEE